MHYGRAAGLGSAVGQCNLAMQYAVGEGVPKDEAKAVHLWEEASMQGLAAAQVQLYSMYGHGGPTSWRDYSKAFLFLKKAVDQDDAEALYEFGLMHMGPGPYAGIPHDPQEGFRIWEKAAVLGSERAIYVFREVYAEGTSSDRQRLKELLPHVFK